MTTPVPVIPPAPALPSHTGGKAPGADGTGQRPPSAADGHRDAPTDPADDAGEVSALRVDNTDLRAQLVSLPVIEQAKGILMSRYQISPDAAFNLLRRWSSHTNLKLRHLSGLLVEATSRVSSATTSNAHAGPVGFIPRSILGLINSVGADQRPAGSAAPARRRNVLRPVGAGGVADTEEAISAELRDAVTEALMVAVGRAGRADVICALLSEGFASADWLAGSNNADEEELASLGTLVAAAHDHHARMAATQLFLVDPR